MNKINFLISILIFSVIAGAAVYFLQPVLPAKATFANFIYIQLFILAVTTILHWGLLKAGEKGNQPFIRFFMGATAGKLFLYMLVMIGYALFNKDSAFGFILHFFMFYLMYTTFEVALVYKKFSSNLSSSKP